MALQVCQLKWIAFSLCSRTLFWMIKIVVFVWLFYVIIYLCPVLFPGGQRERKTDWCARPIIFMMLLSFWWVDEAFWAWKINWHLLLCLWAEDGKETTNTEAPENNPQYTTVYVGNLAPEASDHTPHLLAFYFLLFFVLCTCSKGVCVLAYGHKDVCEFVPVYAVK